MRRNKAGLVMALFLLAGVAPALAETPAGIRAGLETEARNTDPGFRSFSADKGRALYAKEFPTADGPQSCSSCHTKDPRASGLTRANKVIKPLAPSANPARFTDKAKTEKWFRRNCGDVLGRECTPQEKGDLISYLLTVQ